MCIDFYHDVTIQDVLFVDHLELFDGLFFLVHSFQNASELIPEVLGFLIEHLFFPQAFMKFLGGEIEHAALGKALAEKRDCRKSLVGVALSLLEFCDRLAHFSTFEEQLTQFKTDLEIAWMLFRSLPCISNQEFPPSLF